MKVKATRKGFDNIKVRQVDEVFEMDVEKCPTWCVQLDAPKEESQKPIIPENMGISTDGNVAQATEAIKLMQTIDEVEKFCIGDPRDGVQKAAKKRIEQLSE